MKKNIVFLFVVMVLLVTSCSNRDYDESYDSDVEYDRDMASDDVAAGEYEMADEEMAESESREAASNAERTQMVIYNGDIAIEVRNFERAQQQIEQEVERLGGFVLQSSVYQRGTSDDRSGNMTVRVPQEHFFSFMTDLESSDTRVLEKSSYGNDVTEEYVDLESRLRSQEVLEERLLAFLDEAENTEDLLQISRDLSEVQGEIEHIQGRMNYLENHVAFSTISIHIQERAVSSLQDPESLNTFERAQRLFMNTVNGIVSMFSGVVVFMIGFSPVIVPLAIGAGTLYYLSRKRSSDKSV
ncbi:DUF4349 domain-containing protein [Alteribacter aurantiacus]|uniref:DUF4349 domain-containing protein n=1 Tax=Alteribacter aurantiacus TaxID=254410 RepID=UPI0004079CD7|nr:DUF4349 domain-containing protein [Alteribacter aurantiacus]